MHLLADLVAKEVGIERRNAMRTLMAIVDEVDVESDLSTAASRLSEALRAFRRTSAYEDEWAEPLLRLSRWLREDDRSGLQAEILDTSSWQESEERVQSVLETAEWWSADPVAQMRESIPELLEGHCDVVVQVLTSLSSPVVGSLWSQEAWIALGENCDELPPFRTLASVLSDVDRVAAWSGVLSLLEAAFEEEAFEVADALGGPHQPSEVRHVLTCWVDGSIAPERWSAWAELLKSSVDGSLLNDDVGKVVGTIANAVESTQLDRQSALDLAVSMDRIGLVPPQDPSLPDGLGEGWWRTGESVERQGDLIQWLESFTEIWGSTRNASNRYRSNAIVEAVSSGEPLPDVAQDLILDELGMGRVVLEEEDRRTIMEHLSVLSPGRHELAYARVWMLALEESDPGPFEVLEQVLTGESDHHNHALAVWIEAGNARPRELWDVLVRIGPARWRPPIADAITAYAHLARRRDATALVRRMVRSKAAKVTVLLAAVDPASINQSEIAREMALLVDAASNSDERRSVLRRCESLGLTARAAQNELISALDRKRLESTSAAADILKAFPKSLISAPGAHKLMRSMETQVKKAGRSDLVRKVAAIWDRKGKW